MRRPKRHRGLRDVIRQLKFFKNDWKRKWRDLRGTITDLKDENRLLSMAALDFAEQCKQLKQQLKDMEAVR
jgi:hypothetical protein